MKKLSIEEFKKRKEQWFSKHDEYSRELISINKKENRIIEEKFSDAYEKYSYSDDAKLIENQRLELKNNYKGFINIYCDPQFYCVLSSEDDIEKCVDDISTKTWMINSIKDVGKMMWDGKKSIGRYIGIADAIDDYYYLLKDEKSGKEYWCTCVGEIFEYDEPKSYNMVTNGKDYL